MNIEQVYCPAVRCTIYAAAAGRDVSMEGLAIVCLAFQWHDITTSIFKILSYTT